MLVMRHWSLRPLYFNCTHAKNIKAIRQLSLAKRYIANTVSVNQQKRPPVDQQMSFPCLDITEKKTQSLMGEGPEPIYSRVQSGFEVYNSDKPLFLDYGSMLDLFHIAYETWGTLNSDKSNAILLHTGLSASSHAKSQPKNTKPGWWEKFIGPGKPLDTKKYFIVCTNIIGGCYGSTGPSSLHPGDGKRYGTRFPIISVSDMTRAQHRLIKDHLHINKLYASVGCSLGGMQSFAYASEFPNEVNKIVSVSGCVRSHPYSIAMRFSQRQIVMNDANWNRGYYYGKVPPHQGMKLARAVATITYRSGPEWESRFGRSRLDEKHKPAFCPDFLVETYLDHQGDKFSLEYDPNSFLYISKAMDLFDLGYTNRLRAQSARNQIRRIYNGETFDNSQLEFASYSSEVECRSIPESSSKKAKSFKAQHSPEQSIQDLQKGIAHISHKNILIVGVKSDILFPSWQQKEAYDLLAESQRNKNLSIDNLKHVELDESVSQYGHDTFLLDVDNIGGAIKQYLG